jgi:hypothetical protein
MSDRVVGVHRVLLAVGLLAVVAGTGWTMRNTTKGNLTTVVDRRQPDVSSTHGSNSPTNTAAPSVSFSAASSPVIAAGVISDHEESNQHGRFSVTIRKPAGPPRVDLGAHNALGGHDAAGKPLTVACSTCHAARSANIATRESADLDEFHQGMAFAHGNLTCISCHNPNNYDTLHLADGSSVEYSEVMTLCAQCHGPKTRDYQHGAHGGMTGYWDLSRGPRTRNNCVDCHAPHAPRFPAMKPTFKPRDRFLDGVKSDNKGSSGVNSHE